MAKTKLTDTRIAEWAREDLMDFLCDMVGQVRSLFTERQPKYRRVKRFFREYRKKYGDVKGLDANIYKALAGERPAKVRDWAGPKERGAITIVALTSTRMIWCEGRFGDCEGDGTNRLNTRECPLEDMFIDEHWEEVDSDRVLVVEVLNRAQRALLGRFQMPYSNVRLVEEVRRTVVRLQKRAYIARIWVPICAAVAAALSAAVALIALLVKHGL